MRKEIIKNERLNFIDIAKFIGIFCIYLGHFEIQAGNAYNFVFWFHVPLFFFLSGCTETFNKEKSFKKYLLKNIKKILLPFLFFSLTSIVLQCIYTDSYKNVIPSLFIIFNGCIRNNFFAGSLWFLTCLFVVKILFYFFRILLKKNYIIFTICLILFIIFEEFISPSPLVSPRVFFNIDSAFYYIIYYAIGYYSLDFIKKILIWNNKFNIIISIVSGFISSGYSILLFFGKNIFNYFNFGFLTNLLSPLFVIIFILLISKLLENINWLKSFGENTLYLCGSEYYIKLLIPICLEAVGLELTLNNPIATYIYTFILLVICNKYLVPLEKNLFKKIRII